MRFGGAMISLILPKLIRSVARDGIVFFQVCWQPARPLGFSKDTRQVPAVAGNLPRSHQFNFFYPCLRTLSVDFLAAPPRRALSLRNGPAAGHNSSGNKWVHDGRLKAGAAPAAANSAPSRRRQAYLTV